MTHARTLILGLGGRWRGSYGVAACPICQPERHPSQDALTLRDAPDGRLLVHCKKSNCPFRELAVALGLTSGDFTRPDPADIAKRAAERRAEALRKARQAGVVWREALPIAGTLAEAYLRGRGITCALPDTLRFHPACWHQSARFLPALIASVEGCDLPAAHRTYLCPDGSGKANVEPAKAMLGGVTGGSVRLTQGSGPLVIAEGIETALSLACGLLGGPATIWAALSTSGIRGLRLPALPGLLVIASDGDEPGRAAAYALAERAHFNGWQVSMLPAPDGCDWNDALMMKGGKYGR